MADTAVASGLLPHQKDEHDIWTCKDCGWKYPNAKPSPKIRKNHKKHCPGKAGADAHVAGGSSDDASDDDHHHHHSVKGSSAPNPTALDAPAPQVESKSRDFDFSTASVKEDLNSVTAPTEAGVVNGNAKEAPAHEAAPAAVPVPASHGDLMPHQKDEHDIWICKECGWKYPNAKPSPKIRKNHKKHCPGKGGPVAAGGSSDDASDDEHHHHVPAPATAVEPAPQESDPTASAPAEAPSNISRDIDFAALKESPAPILNDETPAAGVEPDAGKGTEDLSLTSEPAALEKAVPEEAKLSETPAPETQSASGLMLHQKDADDVWICKDCGWKYPNAKPSPKIRKSHKKKCPGKVAGGAATTGGSSDEASDDEHHHSSPSPAAPVELPPAVEPREEDPAAAPELPGNISREMDFGALKESQNPAVENETSPASTVETTPPNAVTEAMKAADSLGEEEGKPRTTEDAGAVSLKEAIGKETGKDKEEPAKVAETQQAPATKVGGLMPHQKDENDVWICKECGWRYPNAKPSAKIRKNHKKKCPKKVEAGKGTDGGSSDGASSDDESKLKGSKCFPCLYNVGGT